MDIGFVSLICCFDNLEHKVLKERERDFNVVQFSESNEFFPSCLQVNSLGPFPLPSVNTIQYIPNRNTE